jgi:putative oxidoreductase
VTRPNGGDQEVQVIRTSARRLAHVALGIPFVWLGYDAAAQPGGRVALVAGLGIPEPETVVRLNGAAMVAGGVGLVAGVLPRTAALGLAVSMVPTTVAGHPFWKGEDVAVRKANRVQFLKNVGLVGGLVAVAMTPADRRRA